MSEKNDVGNITNDNVETVKVGDYEVSMKTLEDGKVEIETPEGLEEDKGFQEEATKVVSAMAKANKKGFDTNKRQKELDERENELKRRESEFQLKATQKEPLPSLTELTMKELGVTNEEDLDDVSRSAFLKAQDKAFARIEGLKDKNRGSTQLVTDFITKGGDYNALLNFANSLNAPISKTLINQFTKTTETKPKFASETLARSQGTQISFVKAGGSTPTARSNKADNILKVGNTERRL
jgi:hypothetical protein